MDKSNSDHLKMFWCSVILLNSDTQCSARISMYLNVSGKIYVRDCIFLFRNQWLEPAAADQKWNLLSGKNLQGSNIQRLNVQRQIWWLFVLDMPVKMEGFRIFFWHFCSSFKKYLIFPDFWVVKCGNFGWWNWGTDF